MEQSVYVNRGRSGFRDRAKTFFAETFRPHTRAEYAEVFTRGIGENKEGFAPCPWLYVRAFALFFALFGLVVFTCAVTENTIDFPTLCLFGGLTFNIPLLIFFYELYPKRDFSFLIVLAVLLIGGLCSGTLSSLGYRFVYDDPEASPWISQLWTGFSEELSKAIPAIVAVLLLKKRDPLLCFILGAAVGTGFSICEDMGYVFVYGRMYAFTIDMQWAVLCAIGRGFSCVCSHAPWTGVICRTFAKLRRPLADFRFYAVLFGSMALHYFSNIPFFAEEAIWYRGGVLIWVATVGIIFAEMFLMIRASRRELLPQGEQLSFTVAPAATESERLCRRANLTGVSTCLLVSLLVCVFCVLPAGYERESSTFSTAEELVGFMQNGLSPNVDWERAYEEESPDYSQLITKGELRQAVQQVSDGERNIFYHYSFGEEGATLTNVGVAYGGAVCYGWQLVCYESYAELYSCYPFSVDWVDEEDAATEDGGESEEPSTPEEPDSSEEPETPEEPEEHEEILEIVNFFWLNEDAASLSYDAESGIYTVTMREKVYKGLAGQIAVGTLTALVAVGGVAAYLILKRKAQKKSRGTDAATDR